MYVLGLKKEVVKGIGVYVNGRGASCHKARPLPPIILGIQQEICAHNGNANGDHSQNGKHEQHKAIDIIDFIRPERGEDKVPVHQKREREREQIVLRDKLQQ